MRLYDTISQSELNNVIDKLLGNFHRELSLDLDDPVNNYYKAIFGLKGNQESDIIKYMTGWLKKLQEEN